MLLIERVREREMGRIETEREKVRERESERERKKVRERWLEKVKRE